MKIAFRGENEDGNPEYFENWQELAKACPWALVDPDTLSKEKRLWLLEELLKTQGPERFKDGDERVEMIPSPFLQDDNIVRFASANIPILIGNSDLIVSCEQEANAFLTQTFGTFDKLSKIFITATSGKKEAKLNETPPPMQDYIAKGGNYYEGARGDSLLGAFYSGELKPLTKIWHAVRIIEYSIKCREAVAQSDISTAINLAILIGESRKALSIKLMKAADTSRGGKARADSNSARIAERDHYIKQQFSKLSNRLSVSEKCGKIEKLLAIHQNCLGNPPNWKPIKKRQITTIVGAN